MWCEGDMMWCDVRVMWCDVMVQVSMLCQWYLTKLVGEIFLWYKYPCYVNDISRNWLVRYFCGTSIHAMSIISHEISCWDVFVVQVSLFCQGYLAKLVGEIFVGTNDACDPSESVIDIFWISSKSSVSSDSRKSSDSSDSSNSSDSSDSSKSSDSSDSSKSRSKLPLK